MIRDFASNGHLRILLLEDNEPDAYLIQHAMSQSDPATQIDRAATHRQFTELLARNDYDLVLADYRLPDWTGMEALRELRRLGFQIPLIIVTGNLGDELAGECVKEGAADYVLKTGTLARLPVAVKRALEEKRARDETGRAQQTERAEWERRENEDQFRQDQKMEAVGRRAGGIAHDFNNLLTVIMSYTDMLSEGFTPSDPRTEDLDQIRKATIAASSLTRQLLAFSGQQRIEPRPVNPDDVVPTSQKLLRRPPLPTGTETVLLAEDAADVRLAARQILERAGYTVLEAPTGTDALMIASKREAPIHLLLTDVVMPEMSGSELAEQFTEFRPASKVLYMSGYTDEAAVSNESLRPGAHYLQKPFSPDTLARKVRDVLDSSTVNANNT